MLFLLSCASKKHDTDDYFEVYDSKVYDDYTLYYGNKNNDTIVFVGKTEFVKKCSSSFKKINRQVLNPVKDFTTNNDSIIFYHYVWDVNHHHKVAMSNGSPGQKNKIYVSTYLDYPYLIDDCDALR